MEALVGKHYGGWNSEILRQDFGRHEDRIVFADDVKIGFLSYKLENQSLFLRNIQIVKGKQGQGFGTRVMKELERVALDSGCNSLSLAVFPDNPADRFYRRLGFTEIGKHRMLIMMKKSLSEEGVSP